MGKGEKSPTEAKPGEQPVQSAAGSDLKLPVKPARHPKTAAPGSPVDLITNLYIIALKSNKPIYRHTIAIESLDPKKAGKIGSDKKSAVPRKIPKEMRHQACKHAVRRWLKNNPQQLDPVTYKYALDSNASTMYSLFRVLDEHDGSPGTRASLQIESSAPSSSLEAQKLVVQHEHMLVKIFSPTRIDVTRCIEFCAGRLPRSSVDVEETLKMINILLMPMYLEDPGYLNMQHGSGITSTFSLSEESQFEISKGLVCNTGFTVSVRPSEVGLVAVIGNTCAPFYRPLTLLEFLKQRYRVNDFSKPLAPSIISELRHEFRARQVEATHLNYGDDARPHYRKYRVHDIGQSTVQEKFDLKDDETGVTKSISVFDYFKKEYPKCVLKYPNLPCILDNKRKIPLEICRLVDKQKISRELDVIEASNVIRHMSVKPEIHFGHIRRSADDILQHSQTLKDFGLEIEPTHIKLRGRELPPITLLAAGQRPVITREGQYDVQGCGFVKPVSINKWALVVFENILGCFNNNENDFRRECTRFCRMYRKVGQGKGIQVAPMGYLEIIRSIYQMPDQHLRCNLRKTFEFFNGKGFEHVIFLLPYGRDWLYSYLQYLEVDVPRKLKSIRTCTRASCIRDVNFVDKILRGSNKCTDVFLSNLWLKYNTKLGGVNIALQAAQTFGIDPKNQVNFLAPGWLFVSIDVCHPAPGDRLEQSVAAAVAMWNITNPSMSYCTRIRVQRKDKSDKEKSTVEQVGEIGVMFEEILQAYHTKMRGKVPTNIVILRDGVSEGQFQMVLRFELGQIKQKITNFYNKLKVAQPKLTCLTVQKRNKVRFMREKPVVSRKRDGSLVKDHNIQPGTVVDNTIVQPNDFSFYLAPHKAIHGTTRTPHIYMIYDDSNLSQDSAHAMIFALSYLSPRCNKGTSIPTPVNLADLAAERGKDIVVSWNEDNCQRKLTSEERLAELNTFLSTMGDAQYHTTLYYV